MSRSKYVSVGDTGGLILDSKYDDFVTNAQLESKLGGIENRLVALEQKLTDGSQKVQLSGTIVELGLLADRPTATPENKGMGYFAWDAPEGNKLTYSDGTKWVVI